MARNLRIASVVVDLVANSARYVDELKKANRDTQRYTRKMASSFSGLTQNIAGMAAGYLSFTAAIESFNRSLTSAKDIDAMARLAGQSVEDFQAAAYATERYGISAEKLGDISKDVQDKLGDFIATGGGEFKDFFEQVAPKVGLTAEQLQGLSGPDVLLRVKKAMEDANVPMEQQIFYLESIANDASKLIPLLADNGEEMNRLTSQFHDMDVALSKTDIKVLKDMETAFANAKKEAESLSNTIWVKLSGAMIALANNSAEFFKQFKENVEKAPEFSLKFQIGSFEKQIRESEELINNYRQTILAAKKEGATDSDIMGAGIASGRLPDELKNLASLQNQLKSLKAELDALTARPQAITIDIKVPKKEKGVGSDVVKSNGNHVIASVKKDADAVIKENQRLLDSLTRTFATQEQLINQNYLKQVEQIGALQLTREQLEKAGYDNLLQLQTEYLLQAEAVREESLTRLKAQTEAANDEQATSFDGLAKAINASTDTMAMAATNWANSFSTELANMVTQGQMDFGRLAESIINDILRIAIQANITQPLLQGMGLVPGKATGGPVMRGQTYLVGEKGPELFTASNSGNITPNHKLGGNTQVNIYTQPGETAETRTRQTEQGDIIEVFMKQVDSRMNEQISRGQGLARTLEGRYALSRKSY